MNIEISQSRPEETRRKGILPGQALVDFSLLIFQADGRYSKNLSAKPSQFRVEKPKDKELKG